jgi:hypothetical protein
VSLRQKLLQAANAAAVEATTNERARALWCLDQVLIELRQRVSQKLLSTVQLEAATMKLKIAGAVCMELRRAIVSGVRPPSPPPATEVAQSATGGVTGQSPNTADLSVQAKDVPDAADSLD